MGYISGRFAYGTDSGGRFLDINIPDNDRGDGIGDTPFAIPGGISQDRYPLMSPVP